MGSAKPLGQRLDAAILLCRTEFSGEGGRLLAEMFEGIREEVQAQDVNIARLTAALEGAQKERDYLASITAEGVNVELQQKCTRLTAALESEPTPEMVAAGMKAWDETMQRIKGVAWPEMMAIVYKAMARAALQGEG